MLFKEDVEQSLKGVFTNLAVDGDTIRALTELYNSLPSSETEKAFLTTRDELQELADELNKAEPIDWHNGNQVKYSINFDFVNNTLGLSYCFRLKGLDIYSTDKTFLEKAKERIGEDRLIKLFKEEI